MHLTDLNVDRFLADKPLAISLSGLEELRAHIIARLSLFAANPQGFIELRAAERNDRATPGRGRPRAGAVGIIPIRGSITQHPNTAESGDFASTEDISQTLRLMLAEPDIAAIVLDIDSPGGTTFGVAELAAEIREARRQKPIVAYANSTAASAAYWLGSQADQFLATRGAVVGSIGVYGIHQDISAAAEKDGVRFTLISAGKYKTAGNSFEPLGDEVRARMQARVDEVYEDFLADVALGRVVPINAVRHGFGEGDVVNARQAKSLGMIDDITTFDQAVARALTLRRPAEPAPRATGHEQTLSYAPDGSVRPGVPDFEGDAPEESPEEQPDEEGLARQADLAARVFQERVRAASAA